MKNTLLVALILITNFVSAQTFSKYIDKTQTDGRGFAYNITVRISLVRMAARPTINSAGNETEYTITLVKAEIDKNKGYYNYGKYYNCTQLQGICNIQSYENIQLQLTYNCQGKELKSSMATFHTIGEQQTTSLAVNSVGGSACFAPTASGIGDVIINTNNEVLTAIETLIQTLNSGNSNPGSGSNTNPVQSQAKGLPANTSGNSFSAQTQTEGSGNFKSNAAGYSGTSNNPNSASNTKSNNAGSITNMSNYVGIEGSKESIQVFQQNGAYYVKTQNGTVSPTTKQYFDQVSSIGSKNAEIKANLEKTLNTPVSNYNSETNTYSNPLPSYNNSSAQKSGFEKGYETGQQIADVATPLVLGVVDLWRSGRIKKNESTNNAIEEHKRRQGRFWDDCFERSSILKTWQGFNDYVVKQIPYLLAQPSPTWETLLGSPKYAAVFGKDLAYIAQNCKPKVWGKNKITKDVSSGEMSMYTCGTDFLKDFYGAYSDIDYPFNYYLDNVPLKDYTCYFIFDENNIVIGIKIEIDTYYSTLNYNALSVDKYIQDIKNKIGNNYIPINGNTFLLKDKLIIFNYDDIVMYDMNYFYDKIRFNFPNDYLNIEKLSNGQFKLNSAGIRFKRAVESGALQSKKLQTGSIAHWMKDKIYESYVISEKGIIVDRVTPGSIADKAGLKDDDIITELRGEKVIMPYMFQLMMLGYAREGQLNVSYLRDGQEFKTVFVY
jgi:hypothetical protein